MSYESSEFSISAGIGAIKRMTPVVLVLALQVVGVLRAYAGAEKTEDIVAEYASYAFGKSYVSVIHEDAIARTPAWSDSAENPPISARRAMKLADAKRKELVKDRDGIQWRRVSLAIESIKTLDEHARTCHYWRVHYEAHKFPGGTGIPNDLDIFILMDGTVINPLVAEDNGR